MAKNDCYHARLSTSKSNIHKLHKKIVGEIPSYKQVTRISALAMEVLVSMERDLLERLALGSHELMLKEGKRTLRARTVQINVRMQYNGEIAKHAIIQGMTAVSKHGGDNYTPIYKASFIKFIVKRMELYNRISALSMIYLAAVIEYTLGEVIELATQHTNASNKATITPADIYNAICKDNELAVIFNNVTIPQTGKGPIHSIVSFDTNVYNDDDNDDGDNLGLDKLSIKENDNDNDDDDNLKGDIY